MSVYDFTIKAWNGSEVSLVDYRGKVLLIVNTATGCGFTPQYEELQNIYSELKEDGLEILDFPCNQFGGQAPGGDEKIHSFFTGRFGITREDKRVYSIKPIAKQAAVVLNENC